MKLKNISKFLTIAMFVNNIGFISSASTLSSDGRYESVEGYSLKIDDNYQSSLNNLYISGNTLVSPMKNAAICRYAGGAMIKMDNGNINVQQGDNLIDGNSSFYIHDFDTKEPSKLKSNTKYTIFMSGTINFDNPQGEKHVQPFYRKITNGVEDTHTAGKFNIESGVYFSKQIVFTTVSDEVPRFGFVAYGADIGVPKNMNVYFHIVEGDVSELKIPYFEGMKSVGQNEGNQLALTIQNKNIVPELEEGQYNNKGEKVKYESNSMHRTKDFIKVSPGDTFIYSNLVSSRRLNILFYDSNKSFIEKIDDVNSKIIIPDNVYYITFYHYLTNSEKLQLEYGDVITDYVEPVTKIKNIKLKEPLRAIPNSVKDEIVVINNKPYVKRVCSEIIVNGDDRFEYHINTTGNATGMVGYSIRWSKDDSYKEYHNERVFSDTIPYSDGDYHKRNKFSISGYTDMSAIFVGAVPRTYLSTVTRDGLKDYFKNNPTTVIYRLATPLYEPLKVDWNIDLYNTTLFNIESTIPAMMKVELDRAANRAKERIQIALNNPTTYNISQARHWINLMDDSTLKDNFQEQINTKTDIVDLNIDKKTASANIDVYVKMKNTLSLSLDTNSITFEDFNASEDLEMKNAVNLMVSSSLPYKVNAYLEDEIYNTDKTAIIDKSVLNIKNSGDTTYKAFNEVSEALVLLDNQIEGDNISHSLDLILRGGSTHKTDTYKTTLKFEVEQK